MFISEDRVRSVLSYEALFPALRQALIDYSAGRVDQPQRMILRAGNAEGHDNGWFALMPVVYGDVMAVKTVTFFAGNAQLGLPTHMAVIQLLDRATGRTLAVMDGTLITEMRTAAVSALALEALAPNGVRSLGVLGSGVQARAHIRALRAMRPGLVDVRIWSRTPSHARRLADSLLEEAEKAGEAGLLSLRCVEPEEAAAADVVVTATASPQPVLQGEWLAPHAVVLAVGAVGPHLREMDDEAMLRGWVVAESRLGVEREAGDVVLSGAKVQAELGAILADPGAFAAPRSQPILFKSVGMAIEDLVAARLAWAGLNARQPSVE